MYPKTYYETFARYEPSDEVFVAIPFSPPFVEALDRVIVPAIRLVRVNGKPLRERVVNRGTTGAPDIHEKIFDGILHARIVLADMTVQASYETASGERRWQANFNVAYEVGLAAAWRNPEDVLLIHQENKDHSYSFDVQNLRHVPYDLRNPKQSTTTLAEEIRSAVERSTFIANETYNRIVRSVPPIAVHFMHTEANRRPFPVVQFTTRDLSVLGDQRIEAITHLLSAGAVRARNTVSPRGERGATIVYEWTELGLRIMQNWQVISAERANEMRQQIASVSAADFPPRHLLEMVEDAVTRPRAASELPSQATQSPTESAPPEVTTRDPAT